MTKTLPARRKNNSAADKIWAAGLAGATCIGLVGVIGVKTAEAQTQKTVSPPVSAAPVALSSSGLTQEDLDLYAAQLEAQRVQLESYSKELTLISNQLIIAQQSRQKPSTVTAVSQQGQAAGTKPSADSKPSAGSSSNQGNTSSSKPKPVAPPPLRKPTTVVQSAPSGQQQSNTTTATS